MVSHLIAGLEEWAAGIQFKHGVNPWLFLGLMIFCAPFFYYSLYRLARALVSRNAGQINLWSSVFLAATALPYIYVMVWGRNLPWYIYIILGAILTQGVWSLIKRRGKAKEGSG